MLYQQGDVLFHSVDECDLEKAKIHESDILVKGESTGHAHRVRGNPLVYAIAGALLIDAIKREVEVVHEEHTPIMLPAGHFWKVTQVQEYDHFKEEARVVRD